MAGPTPPDVPRATGAPQPPAAPPAQPRLPGPDAASARRFQALLGEGRPEEDEAPDDATGPAGGPGASSAEGGPPEIGRRREGEGGGEDRGEEGDGDAEAWLVMIAGAGGRNAAELLSFLEGPPEVSGTDAARAAEVNELADKILERLLVGERADGTAEIRMTFRGEALGGTEVILARAEGGLQVQFAPGSPTAAELLREHGAGLAETLSLRLDDRVVVQVGAEGSMTGDDRQGRSQGHQDILQYLADRR